MTRTAGHGADGSPVVIIGDLADPHVREVIDRICPQRPLAVLDTVSIQRMRFTVSAVGFSVDTANGKGTADLDEARRGWIRRLAPAESDNGLRSGSKDAAVRGAWRALLTAVPRTTACEWLSDLDALLAAENKIVQCRAASATGIRMPPTVVTNDASRAPSPHAGLVAKPLGPGHFWLGSPDDPRVVFAVPVDTLHPAWTDLLPGAPFILQERLHAVRHLRVVTFRHTSWAFEIAAGELPLDWRQSAAAHSSWRSVRAPDVERQALRLSAAMSVRYSSQDWIETADDTYFIDLNPNGQWLFLPDPGASQISAAIADWLQE
ncbi:hypothetical protein JK359_16260 [Streptomyces actinomycinicus]|uniref:ATP-grasp ribosomal peptide maturase n=1 Tax=Streptomyces actinomycinicus TaxID=1695166 RepID=A0A937EI28_9ACTN|nr:hypothetical protein [Streptomyces actinomycinicus]MBL1083508.1 hypothetical protein [Streptomyces actinomycinicus]